MITHRFIRDLAFSSELHHFGGVKEVRETFPRKRRSVSADAALKQELARIDTMTLEERVLAALSMRKRFAWLPLQNRPK